MALLQQLQQCHCDEGCRDAVYHLHLWSAWRKQPVQVGTAPGTRDLVGQGCLSISLSHGTGLWPAGGWSTLCVCNWHLPQFWGRDAQLIFPFLQSREQRQNAKHYVQNHAACRQWQNYHASCLPTTTVSIQILTLEPFSQSVLFSKAQFWPEMTVITFRICFFFQSFRR